MDNQGNILVLEDDDDLREMLADVLRDEGYSVQTCDRGETAIATAWDTELDLVILDVRMPGIDGLDALALMQDHLHGASTLVITGYVSEADSIRALRLGAADYLKKPFELSQFLDKVAELRQRTQQKRQRYQREERLRQLARWNLTALIGRCQRGPLSAEQIATLHRTSQLAKRWYALLGPSNGDTEEIGTAAVICSLSLTDHLDKQTILRDDDCPDLIRSLCGNSKELASLVVHHAARHALQTDDADDYPEAHRELLRQSFIIAQRPLPSAGIVDRAWLDLGAALLQAGDIDNAHKALAHAATQAAPALQTEAQLCLAELARLSHNYAAIGRLLEHACQLSLTLGPIQSAQSHLRAAICLIRAGASGAITYLEYSRNIFNQLQIEPDLSRTILALSTQMPQPSAAILAALERCLGLDTRHQLYLDTPWLLPHLLRYHLENDSDCFREPLNLLVRWHPQAFWDYIRQDEAPEELRTVALELLSSAKNYLPPELRDQLPERSAPLSDRVQESAALEYHFQDQRPILQVVSLGGAEVTVAGQTLSERDWHTSKVKYLFFYLLSHPQGLSEDTIIETFWPRCWETGKQNLYAATSRLRHIFRRFYGQHIEPVIRCQGRLQWQLTLPVWFDLREIRRLQPAVHGSDALSAWQRLLNIGRGLFLPDCPYAWALPIRSEVETLLHQGLLNLSSHYRQRQQSAESLEYARRLLELDPLDQQGCELAMHAYIKLGQNDRALRLYQQFCALLRRELEGEPNIALLTLYHKARLGLHE